MYIMGIQYIAKRAYENYDGRKAQTHNNLLPQTLGNGHARGILVRKAVMLHMRPSPQKGNFSLAEREED